MPASLMIPAHRADSAFIIAANSSGEFPIGSAPICLEAANLKGGPEWQEEWDDLIATLWRAARSHTRKLPMLDPRLT
jgi:hypothetical protein